MLQCCRRLRKVLKSRLPCFSAKRDLTTGPLGSWTSAFKELPFFVRTVGFFPSTAWFLDKLRAASSQKWRTLGRSLPAKCATGYSLVTVLLPKTSKLPFFVGAGGFEPPASWSRKKIGPSFRRKSGGFEAKRVHTAHTVHEVSKKLAQICHTYS